MYNVYISYISIIYNVQMSEYMYIYIHVHATIASKTQ